MAAIGCVERTRAARFPFRISIEQDGRLLFAARSGRAGPRLPLVFAGNQELANHWALRWLTAAFGPQPRRALGAIAGRCLTRGVPVVENPALPGAEGAPGSSSGRRRGPFAKEPKRCSVSSSSRASC